MTAIYSYFLFVLTVSLLLVYASADQIYVYNIIYNICNWVVTRRQWLFYMQTKHEIGYY